MNAQKFISLTTDVRSLNNDTLPELVKITEYLPYCQIAQILLALNLKVTENIRFNEQLKLSVAYAGNRHKLKKLIEILDDTSVQEGQDTQKAAFEQVNTLIPEEQYVVEAEVEIPAPQPDENTDKKVEEVISQIDEEIHLKELQLILAKRLAEIADEERPLFVHSTYNLEESIGNIPAETTGKAEHGISDKPSDKETTLSSSELIERFIKNEPKITPRKEFFNPVDKARQSSLDHEDIVSETLAKIHFQQGNADKAIKIYEKLMLFYPEKSVYFAAQIKNIKESLQT